MADKEAKSVVDEAVAPVEGEAITKPLKVKSAEPWLTIVAVFHPGKLPEVMIEGTEEHPNLTGKDMVILQKALIRERKLVRRDGSRKRRVTDEKNARTEGPVDMPKKKVEEVAEAAVAAAKV